MGPPTECEGPRGGLLPTRSQSTLHARVSRERGRPEVGALGWSQDEPLRLIPSGPGGKEGFPGAGLDPGLQFNGRRGSEQ